jgi:hypothetical protein
MTNTNRLNRHTATSHPSESWRAELTPTRRPSPQLVLDAVVAGYIHDISQRHRSTGHPRGQSWRDRGTTSTVS